MSKSGDKICRTVIFVFPYGNLSVDLQLTDISTISVVMHVSDQFLDGKLQLCGNVCPLYMHQLLLLI